MAYQRTAQSADQSSIYNLHYCNVFYSRAKREHERLEDSYQSWLNLRDKTRRNLISQIDRVKDANDQKNRSNGSSGSKSNLNRNLERLESQLETMDLEDREIADPEVLRNYPHSIIARRPAYHKLSFQLALQTSEERIRKADEARQLALAQQDVEKALDHEPLPEQGGEEAEEEAAEVRIEEVEEPVEVPSHEEPKTRQAPRRRQSTEPTFKLGIKLDSFLGKLNSPNRNTNIGLSKKVPPHRSHLPNNISNDWNWKTKWGLQGVGASSYKYQPPMPKPE